MANIQLICWCGKQYTAREADIQRGWGLSCSKSHAAIRRDFGRPKATRVDGVKISRVNKKDRGANRITKDNRTYINGIDTRKLSKWEIEQMQHEKALFDSEVGWDSHKDSF